MIVGGLRAGAVVAGRRDELAATIYISEDRETGAQVHHPVRQFSDVSENRSKCARVRAISYQRMDPERAPAAGIGWNTTQATRPRFGSVRGCSLDIRIHWSRGLVASLLDPSQL